MPCLGNENGGGSETRGDNNVRITIFIPYLDSIISALECRFSDANKPAFNLFLLHPVQMKLVKKEEFKIKMKSVAEMYPQIDNFAVQADTWFDMWQKRDEFNGTLQDLLDETVLFPGVQEAILIALTLPVTTCTSERSFSTMRRVKTWLRSTMGDGRLSALCMMSIHRKCVEKNQASIIKTVIDCFGQEPRKLQFLFNT